MSKTLFPFSWLVATAKQKVCSCSQLQERSEPDMKSVDKINKHTGTPTKIKNGTRYGRCEQLNGTATLSVTSSVRIEPATCKILIGFTNDN